MMQRYIVARKEDRQWQGIPAIERAPNGRLWCAFFSGGPKEPDVANCILITTSNDNGVSWSAPRVVIDPPGSTRAYDPALWHDPAGRLWLFYNQADLHHGEFGIWAIVADNSEVEHLNWTLPTKVAIDAPFAFRLNKPTVLVNQQWVLPITWASAAPNEWFAGNQQLQGVAISKDMGQSWLMHGEVSAPNWALENMIIERRNGRLWMLIRTGSGFLWESYSTDGGTTWSSGSPTTIINPGSRFCIRRLDSGRILLINTPEPKLRRGLRVYISDVRNEEQFLGGLELDPRDGVSYPDAVQAPDGTIYAVHDFDRQGAGEIILDIFSEDEILAVT